MFEEDIPEYLEKLKKEHEEDTFFLQQNLGADIHWFFQQGLAALKSEYYIGQVSIYHQTSKLTLGDWNKYNVVLFNSSYCVPT